MTSGAGTMSRDDRNGGKQPTPAAPDVVRPGLAHRLLLLAGLPALGLLLGWLVPRIADWVAGLPWAPMQGPFELVASADDGWAAVAGPAAGLLLGAAGGAFALAMTLRLTFTDDTVRVDKDGESRILARSQIAAVFPDRDRLVVLDRASRVLLSEKLDLERADVARAFAAHGYRWLDADPYAAEYRRWVPDTPELPAAVGAVLKARERALEKKNGTDAAELRDEVQRLGYTVRDVDGRQYWRPLARP